MAVDRLDGKIKNITLKAGAIINMKKNLKDLIFSSCKNIFLHKNKIKLYLASSDGWKEKIPTLIHRVDLIEVSPKTAGKIKNNSRPIDRNKRIEDRLVKYL